MAVSLSFFFPLSDTKLRELYVFLCILGNLRYTSMYKQLFRNLYDSNIICNISSGYRIILYDYSTQPAVLKSSDHIREAMYSRQTY